MVEEGKNIEEIKNKVPEIVERIHVVAMFEDPTWLEAGGRLSPAMAMIVRQMQKIGVRPLMGIDHGKVVLMKVRANAKDKVNSICEFLKKECSQQTGQYELAITHADAMEEANKLKALIEEAKLPVTVVQVGEVTPVLGAHLGPNAIVVGWIKK
jgi:DegV family protein with EDD domain